jgi:CRP-like cAMP-binding protein
MNSQHLVTRDQLRSFVPVNALTDDHLATLMRDREIEFLCKGQIAFDIGDTDGNNVYLVHGELELIDVNGSSTVVRSDQAITRFPLCHRQPRLERAVAHTDCSVVRFDSQSLDNMLCWDQVSNCIMSEISAQRELDGDADWMMTLLRSNLFYKVPPMNIREILDCFEARQFDAEQVVIRQGEVGDCLYFIKSGDVDVLRADSARGKSDLIATLGAGRCFGEDALVNDSPRNATIVMRNSGVLMRLGKSDFFKLLRKPAIDVVYFKEAEERLAAGARWIDVRTQEEFDQGHAKGALHIPLRLSYIKSRTLSKNTSYITYCNTGTRAQAAAYLLSKQGYRVAALSSGFEQLSDSQRACLFSSRT